MSHASHYPSGFLSLIAILSLALAGCVEEKVAMPAESNANNPSVAIAAAADPIVDYEGFSAEEMALEEALQIEEDAFEEKMTAIDLLELKDALTVASRRLKRQEAVLRWSETRYMEKLKIFQTQFVVLELRLTPGVFAGELPEKDVFAFIEYQEACEEVLELLEVILTTDPETGTPVYPVSAPEREQFEIERKRMLAAVEITGLPSTGSVVKDALTTVKSKEYKEFSDEILEATIDLIAASGRDGADDFRAALQGDNELVNKAMKEFENFLLDEVKKVTLPNLFKFK